MEKNSNDVASRMQEELFVSETKGLGKYFQLDVTLKLFGQIIWEWHFPPKN